MHVLARCLASWSLPSAIDSAARGAGWGLGLMLVLLTSSPTVAQVTLAWDPSVSMVDGYRLYSGTASGTYTAPIDVGSVTTYTVTGLTSGQTYYFAVTAYDRTDGQESGKSNEVSATVRSVSGDTTPPTVSMTAPVNNTSVTKKSTVTLSATASDNVGVTTVAFFVNGTLTCSATTSPYTCAWKVPAAPNRTYQLQAKVYDAQANIGTSSTITVVSR